MVKKFLKSKSKRIPAARRYKIEKKVREHNKKLKKIEKTKLKAKRNKKKIITVPSDCPFKQQILTEAIAARETIKTQKSARKEEIRELKKTKKEAAKAGVNVSGITKAGIVKLNATENKKNDAISFQELLKKAQERGYQFEKVEEQKASKNGQSDSSLKAFYKEFQHVISEADVIIEVLDARDPLGTRSDEAEELVRNSSEKKLLLVLNKCDLIPLDNLTKWIGYLRQTQGCSVLPFKANTQKQKDRFGSVGAVNTKNKNAMETKKSIGVSDLMGLLGTWARDSAGGLTVGVIGMPNVGKSSLINSLKRSKACNVGAKPGVTRSCQVVHLDSKLRLVDSPGVCFSKDKGDGISIETILARVPRTTLMLQYGIPEFNGVEEFLAQVAAKFGQIKKGGVPNPSAAEQKIIHDWHTGAIRFFTEPPELDSNTTQVSSIVSSLSKPFSLETFIPDEDMVVESDSDDNDDEDDENDAEMEVEENTSTNNKKGKKQVRFAVNTDVLDVKERRKLKQEFNSTHPHLVKKPTSIGVIATKKQFNKKIKKAKKKSAKKATELADIMVDNFNI